MPYELLDSSPSGRYEILPPDKGNGINDRGGLLQNAAGAILSGAGSIGATLLTPYDLMMGNTKSIGNPERRGDINAALDTAGVNRDSLEYKGVKLGTELLGTAGVGGAIAKPLTAVAPKLAQAIATGGFSTGAPVASRLADMGIRMSGGAINGAVSAGMVGDSPVTGAVIGGGLPPVAKAAGMAGSAIGSRIASMATPEQQLMAKRIAEMTGKKIEDVLSALQNQSPSILGIKPTVPQLLQDPAISQLQRTVINAGDKSIMAREAEQNAARLDGLGRIAPTFGTVNEAADNAGQLIGDYAKSQRAAAGRDVTRSFDAVDPFNESALLLPLDNMKAARDKYLGNLTFGTGERADAALKVANSAGSELIPAIAPLKFGGGSQSLEQAVRSAGGIRGGSGELRDLGIKQSGTTGLVNNKSGKPADILAETMHQRGFIPDNDPATLFDYLRNGNGRNVFASDATEGGMQRGLEAAMGDAPGAMTIAKPVNFQDFQDLRSSIGESAKKARLAGDDKESAALIGMVKSMDSKMSDVVSGNKSASEYFKPDMQAQYREALAEHAAKKYRFDTGPQARIFRQGSDGQAAIQGAEIPREFFNSRASQIQDAQAFNRLAQNDPTLVQALKSYAVTDASKQVTKDGAFSYNKLLKWMESRSGALNETLSSSDRALLGEILSGVKASDFAATDGMAKGSNTIQNAEAAKRAISSGLLDSSAATMLFNKLPLIGQFTGPMIDSLRKTAQAGKAEKLGGLLADPELLTEQLKKMIERQKPNRLGLLANPSVNASLYRSAPVLAAD